MSNLESGALSPQNCAGALGRVSSCDSVELSELRVFVQHRADQRPRGFRKLIHYAATKLTFVMAVHVRKQSPK